MCRPLADVLEDVAAAVGGLSSLDHAKTLVTAALSKGLSATEIVERGVRPGLEMVGKKYEADEYFLSELLYAGSLVSDLLAMLKPSMGGQLLERKGTIVLGTVRGDIHDIGKNIFKMLAESAGFEVHDLGVDVESSAFIAEIRRSSPKVLGLSALLTTTLAEMKNTVDALRAADIRDGLKVLLGGNAVNREFASEIGADAAALDAVEGLENCKMWAKK